MPDYQQIIIGDEILEFPSDMSDQDISNILKNYVGKELTEQELIYDLPSPEDFLDAPIRNDASVIGSATKLMTKPFRDLMTAGEQRIASRFLEEKGISSPLIRGTLGYAGDVGLTGLGILGTGLAGALSVPVELYGLLGGGEFEKKRLGRDIGAMLELPPGGMSGVLFGAPVAKALKPQRTIEAIQAESAGITPPLAAYGTDLGTASRVVSEIPFVAGRLKGEGARATKEIEQSLGRIAPETSKMQAGRQVMRGTEEWLNTTRNKADDLYAQVDKYIPRDTYLPALKTVEFLEDISDVYKSYPAFFEASGLKPLTKILSDLKSGGVLNLTEWKVLRAFRSELGESLNTTSGPLAQGISVGQRKQLFKALTEDLDAAAKASGSQAYNAYKRADQYYKARQKRIEDSLLDVTQIKDPEQAYRYITNIIRSGGAKESARVINALKRSLSADQFQDVSTGIISSLGRLDDGSFDASKMLKDWNRLSDTGKRLVTSGVGKGNAKKELDDLISTVTRMEETGVFDIGRSSQGGAYRIRRGLSDVNSTLLSLLATGSAFGIAGATGSTQAALGIVGGLAATGLTAKAMSNPTFLKALNSALKNNMTPMVALARSKDFASMEARMLLSTLEKYEQNSKE